MTPAGRRGDALQVAAARLRAGATTIGVAAARVRQEATTALGGDVWLGAAARAAHRAHARPVTVADQVASAVRHTAEVLDTLGTALTQAGRRRAELVTEAATLGWRVCGGTLWPSDPRGPLPILGGQLPTQLAGVAAVEDAAGAAAAAALRAIAAELRRLAASTAPPGLVDPVQALLLGRWGRLAGGAGSPAEAAGTLRSLVRAGDPVAVRSFVDTLIPAVRRALVTEAAELVGSSDGVPPALRYSANRLILVRALTAARGRGDLALAARLAHWLRPGRQFLLVDLARGRIAEVLGDLDHAAHVAVLVPGLFSDPASFDRGLAHSARQVYEQATRSATGPIATIAWLGYRPPTVAGGPFDQVAVASAARLRDLIAGLVLRAGVTTTVVAHSYGTVLTGRALRDGLRVDAVVALGSPGMGAATIAGLGAPPGTRVYAGRAPGDYVGWSENFGRDPADPRFGAVRIATGRPGAGGPRGHFEYFRSDTECLRNIARVVDGRYADVTVRSPSRVERVAGVASTMAEVSHVVPTAALTAVRSLTSLLPGRLDEAAGSAAQAAQRLEHLRYRLVDPDLVADVLADTAAAEGQSPVRPFAS